MKKISLNRLASLIAESGRENKGVIFFDTRDRGSYSGAVLYDVQILLLGYWGGGRTAVYSQPKSKKNLIEYIKQDLKNYAEFYMNGSDSVFIDENCTVDIYGSQGICDSEGAIAC